MRKGKEYFKYGLLLGALRKNKIFRMDFSRESGPNVAFLFVKQQKSTLKESITELNPRTTSSSI